MNTFYSRVRAGGWTLQKKKAGQRHYPNIQPTHVLGGTSQIMPREKGWGQREPMIHSGTTGWPEEIASGLGDLISKEKKNLHRNFVKVIL